MSSAPKKTVQKTRSDTKHKRVRLKDIGPMSAEDFITNEEQRKCADQFIEAVKEYNDSMNALDDDSECGWEAYERIESGKSVRNFSSEVVRAGNSVMSFDEAQVRLLKSGVPFFVTTELSRRVFHEGSPPQDIPYSIYKRFDPNFKYE